MSGGGNAQTVQKELLCPIIVYVCGLIFGMEIVAIGSLAMD